MIKKKGLLFFNAYRYLLVPQEHIQTDFYKGINDKESLNKKKNVFFEEFIRSLPQKSFSNIKFQIVEGNKEILVLKMGIKKRALIGTPELTEKEIEDWHSVYLLFNFSKQMFMMQHKTKVSHETGALANKLLDLIQEYVKQLSLSLQFNPILKKN